MEDKILLIGSGGHCRSVLDSLEKINGDYQIGIVARDRKTLDELKDDTRIGHLLIGTDDELDMLYQNGWRKAFITLGSIGQPDGRKRLYELLKGIGFEFPVIADSAAVISREAILGEGTFIGKNAVVNAGTVIGPQVIINSGAIVEHDCRIGTFAHISSGAVLCGEVSIGENTHIGAGSTVRQQITIGKNTMIGIGSVVVRNVPDGTTAYGNPCRVVET